MTIPRLLILISLMSFGYAGPCLDRQCNILVMLPMPFFSHTNNFMPLFRELAARGHNVTIVSPFPQKKPTPNITDVVIPNFLDELLAQIPSDDWIEEQHFLTRLIELWTFSRSVLPMSLKMEPLQKLIKEDNTKFDLVISEVWFIQFPFIAFGHKYNAPVIAISPTSFFPIAAELTGNDVPTSYVPMSLSGSNDRMTFFERMQNFFMYYCDTTLANLYFLREQDSIMREYFKYPGSENLPYITDMLRNISLTLVDHHYALGYPTPHHKNVVEFGGVNAHAPEKLPADLQKIMDSAKEGVIYVSFGSFFNISLLKPFMQDALFNALGTSKQKVLMKLNDVAILKKYNYKNIETRQWFPQSSILAHPNCKLFITHAGLHGLMEGVTHSVPFVAIPMVADQQFNARFIETIKIGQVIDRQTMTKEKLSNAINTVITDPSYHDRIKLRSAIFKDHPVDIMDNAIYWIEYVIRHKGAAHLRPAVLDLHWYQRLMLDVIGFYSLVILVIVYITVKIMTMLLNIIKRMCCSKKTNKKSKKE